MGSFASENFPIRTLCSRTLFREAASCFVARSGIQQHEHTPALWSTPTTDDLKQLDFLQICAKPMKRAFNTFMYIKYPRMQTTCSCCRLTSNDARVTLCLKNLMPRRIPQNCFPELSIQVRLKVVQALQVELND